MDEGDVREEYVKFAKRLEEGRSGTCPTVALAGRKHFREIVVQHENYDNHQEYEADF
jgi:hypothetical protein